MWETVQLAAQVGEWVFGVAFVLVVIVVTVRSGIVKAWPPKPRLRILDYAVSGTASLLAITLGVDGLIDIHALKILFAAFAMTVAALSLDSARRHVA